MYGYAQLTPAIHARLQAQQCNIALLRARLELLTTRLTTTLKQQTHGKLEQLKVKHIRTQHGQCHIWESGTAFRTVSDISGLISAGTGTQACQKNSGTPTGQQHLHVTNSNTSSIDSSGTDRETCHTARTPCTVLAGTVLAGTCTSPRVASVPHISAWNGGVHA